MNDDINNRTFDKDIYKTPQLKTRTFCMRKTKSTYNTLKLDIEPTSSSKKTYNTKTHLALVKRVLNHQSSVKQFNILKNIQMTKTFDINDNSYNNVNKNKRLNDKNGKHNTLNNQIKKNLKNENNKKGNINKEKKDEINKIKINKKILENKNDKTKNNNENEKKINKKENEESKKMKNNKNEIQKNNKEKKEINKNDGINKKIKENKNSKLNIDIKNDKKEKVVKNKIKEIRTRNDRRYNTISSYNTYDNKNEDKKIKKKKHNLKINDLNLIPLPSRKSASPKSISHNLTFTEKIVDTKYSPKSKKTISFGINNIKEKAKINELNDKDKDKDKDKNKENEKSFIKLSKKDKEKINKSILSPKKKETKENKKNSMNTNNKNNMNSIKPTTKPKKQEFLYIPHIVLDPLDVLKNQIEIILSKYDTKIKTLNKSNIENTAHFLIKKHNEEYTNKLQEIYDNQETELIKLKNQYSLKLYKLSINNEEEEEDENKKKVEELKQQRDNEINELEKKFIEKKKELKDEFRKRMEDMKKSYDFEKQKNLNKEMIDEIKKNFVKIFNDRNMMNKKGINFSLKDYKKCIKNNKNKSNNNIDTISKK